MRLALGATAAVVAADVARWWAGPVAGSSAHGLVALLLANLFVLGRPGRQRRLLLALATVSATRVVLVALPMVQVHPVWRLLAVTVPTGTGAALAALHLFPGRRLGDWFRPVGGSTALVAASGVPVGLAAGLLLRPDAAATSAVLLTALALVLVAVADALLWFVVVAPAAVEALGRRGAHVVVGGVVAAGFLGTGPPALVALTGATAAGLAWWSDRHRSIVGPAAALGMANVLAHLVGSAGPT